jgi:cytochrome P450
MLRNGRLADYVHAAFKGIRTIIRLRALSTYNSFTRWLVQDLFFQSAFVRKGAMENLRFSADRVDRRFQEAVRDPPDLWTKPLTGVDGKMSLDEYHSTAQLLMTAGTDTSAIGLSGTLYYLLTNPDCLAKVTEEIRSAFSSMDDVTYEALARQKYLDATLKEGMRLYPPVPTGPPRVTPMPGLDICNYWIPGGVNVHVPHYATSRFPAHFTAPDSFHPERWLGDNNFQHDRLDAVQPFNYGPQNCLGQVSLAREYVHANYKVSSPMLTTIRLLP